MNIDTYEEAEPSIDMDIDEETDLIFDTGIAGFEIAYSTKNKEIIKKNIKRTAKEQYQTRQKLDSIREQRKIDKEINSFSDYWDN